MLCGTIVCIHIILIPHTKHEVPLNGEKYITRSIAISMHMREVEV